MEKINPLLEWTAAAAGAIYLFLVAKKNKCETVNKMQFKRRY